MSFEQARYVEGYRDGIQSCRAALLALDWLKRNRLKLVKLGLDAPLSELDAIIATNRAARADASVVDVATCQRDRVAA
jgi:hypothetical protein